MAAVDDTRAAVQTELRDDIRAMLLGECDKCLDAWLDGTHPRPHIRAQLRALAASLRCELGTGWSES